MSLGGLPIDPGELAALVIQLRCSRNNSGWTREDRAWTQAIIGGLAERGRGLGFRVSPDPEKKQAEYMLDVLWRYKRPRISIALAVEVEWHDIHAVVHDFEKLMHIKSPLKLMVSNIWEESNRYARKNKLKRLLSEIGDRLSQFDQHIHGETYLLVNFNGYTQTAGCYLFVAPQDGKIETASFTPLVLAEAATP